MQNQKNQMSCTDLLASMQNESVKICFFDPQYRGILDKMKYGNEGVRQKKRARLTPMSEVFIKDTIVDIGRVMVPSGYLFLWVDKFHLCEGVKPWLPAELTVVDLIVWDKGKIGMGYRTRRKSEYLVIVQKEPKKAKATWSIKNIPDVWQEKLVKPKHPHQKPELLLERLILATTVPEDLVLDPCAGSYKVMDMANKNNRNFIGCDIEA